jgi:hypothetical protein
MTARLHEIDITKLIDDSSISEKIREHEMMTAYLRDKVALLGDEHDEQWVGMGLDYQFVFGRSPSEVVAQIKEGKSDQSTIVLEYVSSEPIVILL